MGVPAPTAMEIRPEPGPVLPVDAVLAVDAGLALAVVVPVASLLLGVWVYVDARERLDEELAPFVAVAVGGLLLAGSLPGVVAFLVAEDPAVQGFPTALRVVPGLVAVGVYLYVR